MDQRGPDVGHPGKVAVQEAPKKRVSRDGFIRSHSIIFTGMIWEIPKHATKAGGEFRQIMGIYERQIDEALGRMYDELKNAIS